MGKGSLHRQHSGRQRALGLLLLVALSWATAAEFSHHHGLPNNLDFGAKAQSSVPTTASAESDGNGNASRTPLTANDCSICQLHQNLFAALFIHAVHAAPVDTHAAGEAPGVIAYFFEYRTSNPGRAPPANL